MGYFSNSTDFPNVSDIPNSKEFLSLLENHTGLNFHLLETYEKSKLGHDIITLQFYNHNFPDWEDISVSITQYGLSVVSGLFKSGYLWHSLTYLIFTLAIESEVKKVRHINREVEISEIDAIIPKWAKYLFKRAKKMEGFVKYNETIFHTEGPMEFKEITN